MDIIDEANETQEQFLRQSLQRQRSIRPPPFSGHCLSCQEPIEVGRYCDKNCREDHELQLRRNR